MLDNAMRRTVAAQVRARLTGNRDLRARLLANPRAALAAEFDVQIPDDLRVTVVESTPFHQYVALPAPSEAVACAAQSDPEGGFEALLRQRAAQDAAFRQQALADPKGTLERLLHFKLPAQMTLTALEDTPQTWYLVCPPLTDLLAEELDDQALEAVAGGASSVPDCKTTTGGSGAEKVYTQSFHRPRYPVCH